MRTQQTLVLAIVSAAIGAQLMAGAAIGAVPARSHGLAPDRAAARTTSLTLEVRGCDGCEITPVKAGTGATAAVWTGKTKTVSSGSVHWTVTQHHTVGMSFNILDPNAVALDVMTNIVIAYRGLAVGERVAPKVAARKKAADGCWAGARRQSVTLRVRVDQFPGTSDFPPVVHGYRIRPYLVRTARHIPSAAGAYTQAFHGTIGNQDAYFCSK